MKAQRAACKNDNSSNIFYEIECPFCKKTVRETRLNEKRCARCLISYCSEDCYRNDWPQHKKTCKPVAAVNNDDDEELKSDASIIYDKYGTCTETTRERLALWTNTKFFMSLTERTQRVDAWRYTKPMYTYCDVPVWLEARITKGLRGRRVAWEQDNGGDDEWSIVTLKLQ
jgi:MYND finger